MICNTILMTSSTDDCEHRHFRNSRRWRCICFRVSCGLTRTLTQIYSFIVTVDALAWFIAERCADYYYIHFYALYPTESKTLFIATGNA